MTKTLSDALKAAKKERNVLSKLIIWESGVSKSQFYRIIKGEEAPSPESKERISKSLGLDKEQFDLLFNSSKIQQKTSDANSNLKTIWAISILALCALLICVTLILVNSSNKRQYSNTPKSISNQEDDTVFIEDVTIPDGTSIPINTTYTKTWRVKNSGKVVWKDRYLTRITPASSLICTSPKQVPIPETHPGETVDISVTFKTPYLPGSCRTDWKATDKDGNLYFPDMHGLYSIVLVTAK